MHQPSVPQINVLLAAVRSKSHRVPSQSFAYAGFFPLVRGCEPIIAVLHRAAQATGAACEKILLDNLTETQLLLAGGILDVDRHREDGRGDLAERYATAIHSHDARIEGTSVASIRACIRQGWLTERWEITPEGRDAVRLAEPTGYAKALPADELDAELNSIARALSTGQRGASKSNSAPTVNANIAERQGQQHPAGPEILVVADEAHADTGQAGEARAALNDLVRAGRDDRVIPDPQDLPLGYPGKRTRMVDETLTAMNAGHTVHVFDPKPGDLTASVAAAMAGYDPGELTAAEQAAAARGITPSAYRRLYPPVTGALINSLLPRIRVIRDDIVRRLTEAGHGDAATMIAGDPREAGYRVALTAVRRDMAHGQAVRRAVFHLEIALTVIKDGHRRAADDCLAKASAVLAR